MGFVIAERASNIWKIFVIALVPFVFNTACGFIAAFLAGLIYQDTGRFNFFSGALVYLGVAAAYHAFPSLEDAKAIDDELWRKDTPTVAKIICAPWVFLFAFKAIVMGPIIDMFWGVGFGFILPFLLLHIR